MNGHFAIHKWQKRKGKKTKEAEMQGKKEHIEKAYISVLKKKKNMYSTNILIKPGV